MSDKVKKLLEIANQIPTQPKPRREDNEAEKFIKEFGIESGETKVPAIVIYDKYKQWRKDKSIEMRLFFRMFIKFFQKKQTSDGATYLLNPKHFDLRKEHILNVRRHLRKDYEHRYGKKESNKEEKKD